MLVNDELYAVMLSELKDDEFDDLEECPKAGFWNHAQTLLRAIEFKEGCSPFNEKSGKAFLFRCFRCDAVYVVHESTIDQNKFLGCPRCILSRKKCR